MTDLRLKDRTEAGKKLADALEMYQGEDVIIFALPRGGVVIGAQIARRLNAPLDLVITKKIGHPLNPEYAICAIAEEGEPICNEAERSRVDSDWFYQQVENARTEIKRRRREYFGKVEQHAIEGKIAIIVDDGVATGFTMTAAIREIKTRQPKKVVVAIPIAPNDTAQALRSLADDVVSLFVDYSFLGAVSAYYEDFRQVEDQEVITLLKMNQAE